MRYWINSVRPTGASLVLCRFFSLKTVFVDLFGYSWTVLIETYELLIVNFTTFNCQNILFLRRCRSHGKHEQCPVAEFAVVKFFLVFLCILQNSFYLYFSMAAISGISQCPCCPARFVLLHAVTLSCFLSHWWWWWWWWQSIFVLNIL